MNVANMLGRTLERFEASLLNQIQCASAMNASMRRRSHCRGAVLRRLGECVSSMHALRLQRGEPTERNG